MLPHKRRRTTRWSTTFRARASRSRRARISCARPPRRTRERWRRGGADVLKSWDEQIASIRRDIESKKAEHDVKAAQRKADSAEEDAEFAIQYAYWAVEEAEYAVLDAQLARMDADSSAESRS